METGGILQLQTTWTRYARSCDLHIRHVLHDSTSLLVMHECEVELLLKAFVFSARFRNLWPPVLLALVLRLACSSLR